MRNFEDRIKEAYEYGLPTDREATASDWMNVFANFYFKNVYVDYLVGCHKNLEENKELSYAEIAEKEKAWIKECMGDSDDIFLIDKIVDKVIGWIQNFTELDMYSEIVMSISADELCKIWEEMLSKRDDCHMYYQFIRIDETGTQFSEITDNLYDFKKFNHYASLMTDREWDDEFERFLNSGSCEWWYQGNDTWYAIITHPTWSKLFISSADELETNIK